MLFLVLTHEHYLVPLVKKVLLLGYITLAALIHMLMHRKAVQLQVFVT